MLSDKINSNIGNMGAVREVAQEKPKDAPLSPYTPDVPKKKGSMKVIASIVGVIILILILYIVFKKKK